MDSDRDEEICPDAHHCLNGAKCVEDNFNEGTFFCDCEQLGSDSEYAGLYCEHKSTQFCHDDLDPDSFGKEEFFCTNFGDCYRANHINGKIIYGCSCPIGYVGDRCQFIEGTNTEALEKSSLKSIWVGIGKKTSNESGMTEYLYFFIVLISFSIFVAVLIRYVVEERRRSVMDFEEEDQMIPSMLHPKEAENVFASTNSYFGDVEMTEDMVYEGEKKIIDVDGSKTKKKKKKKKKKSKDSSALFSDSGNDIL
mmetsp:Transcript_13757/g.20072  ORF Transcript_13757/g.20072 Transcript_13757/m.20072 type:complete len:252 (-) Transcript_13757:83-838(-)